MVCGTLVAADTPATLESNGLRWSDTKRLDGAFLLAWEFGRPLVWDFACTLCLATSCASYTILEDSRIVLAEHKMRDKYHELEP